MRLWSVVVSQSHRSPPARAGRSTRAMAAARSAGAARGHGLGGWPGSHASYSARGHGSDGERHLRVEQAAELGALPAVRARLVDGDLELLVATRNRVVLGQERGHVEGVDHVTCRDREQQRLTGRHHGLRPRDSRPGHDHPLARVREAPAPAETLYPDLDRRLRRTSLDGTQHDDGDREEQGDGGRRDGRPQPLPLWSCRASAAAAESAPGSVAPTARGSAGRTR